MSVVPNERRAIAAIQFHRARRRAALESLLARFSGQSADLLSYDEVVGKLGVKGQSTLGLRQIPIKDIVGSVGRYQDFSRTFLPRLESDEDRWVNVGAAAPRVSDLPPISVYKIGDAYFVLDGNHRVSLARAQRIDYLDAHVIEVRTRAPLPPGASPDGLIVAAEQAAFLAYTRLDLLRPDVDVTVSVPGQYRHLESHIEAYRYLLETRAGADVPFEDAVARWYDEAYLPMVQAIREQGILRYFPGRTETDFFIWLARHRADLQNELGTSISPDVAVSRLASRVAEAQAGGRAPVIDRLRRLTGRGQSEFSSVPLRTWAEERTLGRYSDHLFANVLYPIGGEELNGWSIATTGALVYALALSEAEGAQFCALCVLDHADLSPTEMAAIEELRHTLERHTCPTIVLIEKGDPVHWTLEVAYVNDLIVLARDFAPQTPDETAPTAAVRAVLAAAQRPLYVAGTDDPPLVRRVLLVHDTRRQFEEALFIATYLAEQGRVDLTVLPLSNGRNTSDVVDRITDYLAMHEVAANFLEPVRPTAQLIDNILEAAQAGECDLIVLSGPERGRRNRNNQLTEMIWDLLQRWPHAILVAA